MPRKPFVQHVALLLLVLGLVSPRSSARAQDASQKASQKASQDASWKAPADTVQRNAVQVWGGYSPGTVRVFGKTRGARFATAGVRYVRLLAHHTDGQRALDYVADVLPLAAMTYAPARGAPQAARRRGERTLYGVGLTPLGLRLRWRRTHRWQPYLEGGVGFVRFFDPLPDRRGERFNFTFRAGVGLRVEAGAGLTFTLGYRYHHLSNGFRGRINPGFDSNLFHLGLTLARF